MNNEISKILLDIQKDMKEINKKLDRIENKIDDGFENVKKKATVMDVIDKSLEKNKEVLEKLSKL